jgi:manganese/zinc/iron transport system permease protein
MLLLAAFFGAAAGVSGALISFSQSRLPTGPVIILSVTTIVIASVFFGTARGLVWEWLRQRRHRLGLRPPPVPEEPVARPAGGGV